MRGIVVWENRQKRGSIHPCKPAREGKGAKGRRKPLHTIGAHALSEIHHAWRHGLPGGACSAAFPGYSSRRPRATRTPSAGLAPTTSVLSSPCPYPLSFSCPLPGHVSRGPGQSSSHTVLLQSLFVGKLVQRLTSRVTQQCSPENLQRSPWHICQGDHIPVFPNRECHFVKGG